MAEFDYGTRREISQKRKEELDQRIKKLSGQDKELAMELTEHTAGSNSQISKIAKDFYLNEEKTPSQWFLQKGLLPGTRVHKGLLDTFVPEKYQKSYLYIIDKLNRFLFLRVEQKNGAHCRLWAADPFGVYAADRLRKALLLRRKSGRCYLQAFG